MCIIRSDVVATAMPNGSVRLNSRLLLLGRS